MFFLGRKEGRRGRSPPVFIKKVGDKFETTRLPRG